MVSRLMEERQELFRKMGKAGAVLGVTLLGSILMGLASGVFLQLLDWVTEIRMGNPWLVLFLPLTGVLTVFVYSRYGKGAERGNNLIIRSVHQEEKVPLRMSFLSSFFTLGSHLTGGSVGIEGTAVQIGGTIFNRLSHALKFGQREKRILVMAGISAAFGSAFGAPLAGAFFGLEMSFVGKLSYEAMLPCFLAAYTANGITTLMGITHHQNYITEIIDFEWQTVLAVFAAAVAFGFAGRMFSWCIKKIKGFYARLIANPLGRIALGGAVVSLLIFVFSLQEFSGLSIEMRDAAFQGETQLLDPLKKFLLTVLTLGAGFQGGEVTPLFHIGASMGSLLAGAVGMGFSLFAALGMIGVFGSATNTPVTTIMLGIELFGTKAVPYYILVALVGYYVTGHHGIYTEQRIVVRKDSSSHEEVGESLAEYNRKRREAGGER